MKAQSGTSGEQSLQLKAPPGGPGGFQGSGKPKGKPKHVLWHPRKYVRTCYLPVFLLGVKKGHREKHRIGFSLGGGHQSTTEATGFVGRGGGGVQPKDTQQTCLLLNGWSIRYGLGQLSVAFTNPPNQVVNILLKKHIHTMPLVIYIYIYMYIYKCVYIYIYAHS